MHSIFKKSIELNMKIENFLDVISNSLILFDKAVHAYLANDFDTYKDIYERICSLESEADELEAEIKTSLYKFMLLPDVRADVLSLIKSLDNIIDDTEEIAKDFFIQTPQIPEELHKDIFDLTENTIKSADSLLLAARTFFNEVHLVASHISKVKFYEHETDIIEDKLSCRIFKEPLMTDLAEKLQLKNFIGKIAGISDEAELIGDKLAIFTIRREI